MLISGDLGMSLSPQKTKRRGIAPDFTQGCLNALGLVEICQE